MPSVENPFMGGVPNTNKPVLPGAVDSPYGISQPQPQQGKPSWLEGRVDNPQQSQPVYADIPGTGTQVQMWNQPPANFSNVNPMNYNQNVFDNPMGASYNSPQYKNSLMEWFKNIFPWMNNMGGQFGNW